MDVMGTDPSQRIVTDQAILSGKPVVKGTRISAALVREYVARNRALDDLFADYPRLTLADVNACLAYAGLPMDGNNDCPNGWQRGQGSRTGSLLWQDSEIKPGMRSMTEEPRAGERTLAIRLDEESYAALEQSARGRELQPAELVERWVRERLAHEAERALGRQRPQRPAE